MHILESGETVTLPSGYKETYSQAIDKLFSEKILYLPFEERRELALNFIDGFRRRPINSELLDAAGISESNIKPQFEELSKLWAMNPQIVQLQSMMNYCEYIRESDSTTIPETFSNLLFGVVKDEEKPPVSEFKSLPNVVIKEPFFYDRELNRIIQHHVMENQSAEGKKNFLIFPDSKFSSPKVGVLLFKGNSQAA